MSKTIIIIPAYNEEKNIAAVLRDIKGKNLGADILVIDDGSLDRTKEIAMSEGVNVISHLYNLGYGAALQTGFKYSIKNGYDFVVQFDGDGQHDPDELLPMINELKKNDADIIIGSRFLGKGNFKMGILKKTVVSFMKFLIKLSTGYRVTDPTSGFKGLSGRTFGYYGQRENFPQDYPDADILIQMMRLNYKVREIPVNVRYRNQGTSMHSGLKPIVYIMKILLSILIILIRDRKKDKVESKGVSTPPEK